MVGRGDRRCGEAARGDNVIENLLRQARAARVGLWADGGSIHYRSPEPLSAELRALIIANKPELLVALAAWDAPEARRLMFEADETVDRCGAVGADAEITDMAGRAAGAHVRHDMTGVRSACALIENRARQLAAARKGDAA